MSDKVMSGAELKVQLTGMGLTPVWLADRLGVTTRTVIRWFDLDEVPARAVAEIDWLTAVTVEETNRLINEMRADRVLRTHRVDQKHVDQVGGVAICNTPLPASWHRALTFRALQYLRSQGVDATVEYTAW